MADLNTYEGYHAPEITTRDGYTRITCRHKENGKSFGVDFRTDKSDTRLMDSANQALQAQFESMK